MRSKVISKHDLLKYASQIIKDKGVDACSMRAIALEASIAVGTIYNYYSSHIDMLEDLFELSWNKTSEKLEKISTQGSICKDLLLKYAETLKNEVENRNGLGKKLYGSMKLGSELKKKHKTIFNPIIESLSLILKKSEKNANLYPDELLMVSKWAFLLIMDSYVIKTDNDPELVMKHICNRFI